MNKFTIPKSFLVFLSLITFSISWSQEIAINEIMSSNDATLTDEDGDFEDWIELYNYGTTPVNLEGYGITDDTTIPFKWVFPAQTLQPNEFLLVWASDKDKVIAGEPLHTNFKISSGGETIVLTDPDGVLVNEAPAIASETDVSIGRQPDGTGSWLFFYSPTPGVANTTTGLSELLVPPTFSHDSGLYTESFDLLLSHNNPNAVIVYTTDGSEPQLDNISGTVFEYKNAYKLETTDTPGLLLTDSYTSNTYTVPVAVYDRSAEADQLANKNTRQHPLYTPTTPVRKATIVKARAYVDGVGSKIIAKTFFIWSEGNPYQIPVISLQIQENYLFDYNDGTYTAGVDFDTWRENNPDNNQWYRPEWSNYWRSGSDWEYPVHVEFFESGSLNSVMNINGGFRIHGNNSRALAIKNLRLYARSEYDEANTFEHNLFDEVIPDAPVPNNNEFKRIMLRGDGTGGAIAYDVVFNRIMQPVFNGVTRIKPAIHFINGEFWGLTTLRDRFDKHHYALNFDLDEDNIIQVDCKGGNCEIDEGDDTDYQSFITMRDFIIQNDMADENLFSQVNDILDMESFIDHMVLEVYAANDSYERNFWRVRDVENESYGDGKWRLNVQDFEASLKSETNWMQHWGDMTESANESFLGELLANDGFKTAFINRFADILNTAFTTQRFNAITNETFDEIEPYLTEDINRFPRQFFYQDIEKQNLLNWGTERPDIQREQIRTYFDLTGTVDLILNVSNTDAGNIKINTVSIEPSTPGVPENPYPWTGIYFNNIPVTLEATAMPGYVFSHWSGDVNSTDVAITVTPNSNMEIQANFEPEAAGEEIVYFWLMDSEIPNDTPLEELDATYAANELTAKIMYSSCLEGYPFTSADDNWRKASMERKNSPTPLNYYPEANNDITYSDGIMKGIQIKQPFRVGDLENTIELQTPTTNLQNIKLSLAIESNGAAQTLLVDYWNGSEWTTNGLENASVAIADSYEVKEFDFSNITTANNNPDFKVRIRFDGTDMFIDEGNEVYLNNIAITGETTLTVITPIRDVTVKVYPNPTDNIVNIEASEAIDKVILYTIYGQAVHQSSPKNLNHQIDLENLPTGIYLLKVFSNNTEKTIKVIKQ
ncbi:T9SS C-terminal target domain-containing protein [Flavobacterium arcticum]|uniref:T9SS C-terminal target domain-containing protein n=1 Tax=Flavobacterium arcticum TaxID=1784713 RepID=A0A345HA11_9FLAO|nr:CotH kinase family protein [Flavobacterium arcticum]AXG73421.1 T9SS C-terminal target domain-containing protein [Flavobacterium arcticum]KAF2513208.1 T9SS type A sorting domain-containing protein [Flavobacterium arcticum]